MHHYLKNPTKLQLEISSMCNALCYGCARTDKANFNGKLPLIPNKKILELSTLKKAFTEFESVTGLDFCGTVDDPFMHPQFNDILQLALDSGIKNIFIHTNGSIRETDYWRESARILKQFDMHNLKFSVDGLRDTNHLYRQRTNFDKIMENAQAFIDEGGTAGWQYLVFPWNKHQVEEASELSKQMGFKTFIHRIDRSIVREKDWGIDDIMQIKKENRPAKLNEQFDMQGLFDRFQQFENNEIDCYFQNEQMYFIDFNARLWPCCFIRNSEFGGHNTHWHQVKSIMHDVYNDNDWNRLDLYSVDEILEHPFYKKDIVDSFEKDYGMECGDKMVKCASTCSVKSQVDRPIATFKIEEHNVVN